ncbi:MAG: double-strand break repair helicase AddA [Alphaproteobacteria bacterium]|nr:MAG: double-strand break repair helicase AddA [Alphaproteobacteria bacterium]
MRTPTVSLNLGEYANVLQTRASDPQTSAWVAASAGSGKTKVLIDRLVRLLLTGVDPSRIVCLTFTNAAAAEMTNRLYRRLSDFTHSDEKSLTRELHALNGGPVPFSMVSVAQELLNRVLETPGGVRIDTLHGFSQMVLRRFPLEAGLTPGFEIADEHASRSLMGKAIHDLLASPHPQITTVLTRMLQYFTAETVEDYLRELMSLRWRTWLSAREKEENFPPELTNNTFYETLKASVTPLLKQLVDTCREALEESPFLAACAALLADTPSSQKIYDTLYSLCFTQSGEPRKQILTKRLRDSYPEALESIAALILALETACDARKDAKAYEISQSFSFLAVHVSRIYKELKAREGVLDYDDLIDTTVRLFTNSAMAPWVLYKLDGGIDHMLLDEAQDTSHHQWTLVRSLLDEFFSGNTTDRKRTFFVVGDVKQSIYGFQGADPAGFVSNRAYFRQAFTEAHRSWQDIPFNISFRSTPEVLRVVDSVFADPGRAAQLCELRRVSHVAFRTDAPGRVEIWPLEKAPPCANIPFDAWDAPRHSSTTKKDSSEVLAQRITKTLGTWLREKRLLPSGLRPIQAHDILVLVQRRGPFVSALIRHLRAHSIPVEGQDRYDLADNLGVQDLLNLAEFCDLPSNDLALACVLKSPFVGLCDDELLCLRTLSGECLWEQLCASGHKNTISWLGGLIVDTKTVRPFDFFMRVLYVDGGIKRMAAAMGDEAYDTARDFLSLLEIFEAKEIPTVAGFLLWFRHANTEVIRPHANHVRGVRIMTVHGAKGLQAPIVILPDTVRVPTTVEALSLDEKGDLVYLPSGRERPARLDAAFAHAHAQMMAEYYRLLYVAMTRAEDMLVVCGWESGRVINYQDSWYHIVQSSVRSCSDVSVLPNDDLIVGNVPVRSSESSRDVFDAAIACVSLSIPEHFYRQAVTECPVPRAVSPTSLTRSIARAEDPMGVGAVVRKSEDLREKGIRLHRLFELWPNVSDEDKNLLASPEEIAKVSSIWQHPEYSRFFAGNHSTEVRVRGVLANKPVMAVIDRMGVDEHGVWFLDYKTSTHIVRDPKRLPPYMLGQMGCYFSLLEKIYPGKTITGYILWTHDQSITEVFAHQAEPVFCDFLRENRWPQVEPDGCDDPQDHTIF